MATESPANEASPAELDSGLRVVRWSCSMGSNVQSRAAVVIESGQHRWEATGKGSGAVEALFGAVDLALQEVLQGHPRLVSYDVHAVSEGVDSEGRVTISIAPPSAASGERATGTYDASAQSANIIAASVEAYVKAIETMLGVEHWQGATDAAGNFRAASREPSDKAEFEPAERPDHSRWWT